MITLIRKNLIAHRKKNKLTSLIYSLTLGCVIFLLMTVALNLKTIIYKNEGKNYGAQLFYYNVGSEHGTHLNTTSLQAILDKNSENITDWAYETAKVSYGKERVYDRAFLDYHHVYTIGLTPSSMYDDSMILTHRN
jgi:hypothetical protein